MSLAKCIVGGILLSIFFIVPAFADEAYRFAVSGVVKALPGEGRAANELLVKHQQIPDYRDSTGKVVGMMAMTMPFYLSRDVSLGDIKVGDKVEMTVEQHLEPRFSEEVVSIKRVN